MTDNNDVPFAVEERWPELFEQLEGEDRRQFVNTLASSWHEGWVPGRDEIENMINKHLGRISHAEYLRRADAIAERQS